MSHLDLTPTYPVLHCHLSNSLPLPTIRNLPFHSLCSHRRRLHLLGALLCLLLHAGVASSGCLLVGPSGAEDIVPEDGVGREVVLGRRRYGVSLCVRFVG